METPLTDLDGLIGTELSAVAFVRDYVELHFDGPILRSLSNPSIRFDEVEYQFPEPNSRDALCRAIGSTVCSVRLVEHQALDLVTSNGCQITIPLHSSALRGPEAMHFVPGLNKPIQVW